MLKINLSDKDRNQDQTPVEDTKKTAAVPPKESSEEQTSPQEPLEGTKRGGKSKRFLLVVLLIAVIAAGVYYKSDMFVSLIKKFQSKPTPVPKVMPPLPPPKPEVAPKEPDPVFVFLKNIGEVVPRKVWLTEAVMKYDGTYEIKGIAFVFSAMDSMNSALVTLGTITGKHIPNKSKSSETVYTFSFSGSLSNVKPHDILDVIPTDSLVALADPVIAQGKEFEVKFNRRPKAGETYSEKDTRSEERRVGKECTG